MDSFNSFLLISLSLLYVTFAKVYHTVKDLAPPEVYQKFKQRQQVPIEDLENITFWMDMGRSELDLALQSTVPNTNVAKNILLFVGDGMSVPTLTAARIYKAQTLNQDFERPELNYLTFERFPHMGHSKTHSVDYQIPDSASTASAMFSGVKTMFNTMGYDSHIDRNDIFSSFSATKVDGIMTWAQNANKDTGFVTTARVTHATPAAVYAHSFDRYFEADSDYTGFVPEGVHDIAYQLVNELPGRNAKVMLGGGSYNFCPNGTSGLTCYRTDGLDLGTQWLLDHGPRASLVRTEDELMAIDAANTDYLFGLLGEGHVAFHDERVPGQDPSLVNMTQKALEILMKGNDGFFLLVEGGRIDHAHHDTTARRALSETVVMDLAIEKALDMLQDQLDETLIIATADHAHTMSINGYALRGNDIAGLSTMNYDDGLPFTTLSYANGIDYYVHNIYDGESVTRLDLTDNPEVTSMNFRPTNAGLRYSETHGGDDVAIFAQGPMSHLFHTTHDQTYIAHVMAYSGCIGPYANDLVRCAV